MRRPTIYLFDIDGTLITTGGVARSALVEAFADSTGLSADAIDFSFGGMTDRWIVRRGLEASGLAASWEAIDDIIAFYLERLEERIDQAPGYRVHEGIVSALDVLAGLPAIAVGLGTGNVERGARIKLARGGLNARFPFGGFGCDSEDRAELIAVGILRGARRLRVAPELCRVVVIGDTVRDVAAAHANGAECVAVATGGGTEDELREAGADHVFPTLAAPGAIEALLGRIAQA